MCPKNEPDIENGAIDGGDTAPYFINEIVRYTCNTGFTSNGADLTNTCQQNTGPDDLMWSRSSMDLNGICRASVSGTRW